EISRKEISAYIVRTHFLDADPYKLHFANFYHRISYNGIFPFVKQNLYIGTIQKGITIFRDAELSIQSTIVAIGNIVHISSHERISSASSVIDVRNWMIIYKIVTAFRKYIVGYIVRVAGCIVARKLICCIGT